MKTEETPHRGERVSCIIKFGVEEHLQELRSRGVLHMNRLDYFRRHEEETPLRFDRWEGVDVVIQPGRGHISIDGRRFEIASPGLLRLGGPPAPHVFCAYALTPQRARAALKAGRSVVDLRNAQFGTHAVIILDVSAFLTRAESAVRKVQLDYEAGLVEYVSAEHNGDLGVLRKRDVFSYQSEFRLAVHGSREDVCRLEIGSLEEISLLVKAPDAASLEATFDGDDVEAE